MPTTIKLRNSVTTTSAPSSLVQGEVAINITDKKVWVGNAATTPIQLLGDGASLNFTSLSLSGNLTFTGTGNRITGDFSNATFANRVAIQSSVTNDNTFVSYLPNGTGTIAGIELLNGSDASNASVLQMASRATEARIASTIRGTGTFTPLTFFTNNVERLRIDTSGNVGIGTSTISERLIVRQDQNAQSRITLSNQDSGSSAESSLRLSSFGGSWDIANGSAARNSNALTFSQVGGSERMRIDSNGNVGIGTSTAYDSNSRLTLSRNTGCTFAIRDLANGVDGVFGVAGNGLSIGTATNNVMMFNTNAAERMRITSDGKVGIGVTPSSVDGIFNVNINGTAFHLGYGTNFDNYFTAGSSGIQVFRNAGTERMRITAAGELLVGQTAVDGKVVSNSGSAAQRSYHGGNLDANCNTDGVYYAFVNRARTTAFNFFAGQNTSAVDIIIYGNGNIVNTNGSYGTISDAKNKENIVDATPKLDKVNQLKVRNFNFKGDDFKQIGFIAQEFEEVFPSMVEESQDRTPDGELLGTTTKTIKTTVLIPILVKAMQEQQAMIEELKQEVAKLKGV